MSLSCVPMRSYRRGSRFQRLWRVRRIIWRAAFALIVLSIVTLIGLFWSLSMDNVDPSQLQKPPPQYGEELIRKDPEGGGKVPFRRASRRLPVPTSPPALADAVLSSRALWFNGAADGGEDAIEGTGTSPTVYQSHGVARVVLEHGTTLKSPAETAASALPPAHLLAANVSWEAYMRYMRAHGIEDEARAAAAANTGDVTRVEAVTAVEVQLLRQRVMRNVWAAAEDMEAIVGIVPVESTMLSSADELLVEQYLRAEGRLNASPDMERFVQLVAAVEAAAAQTRDPAGAEGRALRVDRSASAFRRDGGTSASAPLLVVQSVHRPPTAATAGAAMTTKGITAKSSAATRLAWRAGYTASRRPLTVEVTLDAVHPHQSTRTAMEEESVEAYTPALQATVCSSRIVRLYGLSSQPLQSQQQHQKDDKERERVGEAATATGSGIESISLNMPAGVELLVGGPLGSPAGARMAGVVPLLYIDLDTSDTPQPSLASSTSHRTVGLLWLHPAPFLFSSFTTNTNNSAARTCVRLRSTAGSTKLYLLPGPTPADVLRQYYTLTGFPTLPPRFLLGYHHGLRGAATATEAAVEALDAAFLRARVPLDSVWVTDTAVAARDTPFTWNTTRFPDAVRLQSNLWYGGRRYVVVRTVPTIPITTRSPLYLEGRREGFFVTIDAEESIGWPTYSVDGVASHVVDFTNPSARRWYGNMLKFRRYVGSTNHTFISLQHAAPTVMADAPDDAALSRVGEVLPMEVGHHGSFTHREVHQLLPVSFAQAVHEGMLRRTQYVRRAMVLTKSYYAGIQRYAVVEVEEAQPTAARAAAAGGSVLASAWTQLRRAVRQCAQLSALGVPFSGANLGAGLTGEVLTELLRQPVAQQAGTRQEAEQLLVRWYQAGVFFAMMYAVEDETVARRLAESGAARAGPWWMRLSLEAATQDAVNANVLVRYALVPYLYTVAYKVSETGSSFFAPLPFTLGNDVTPRADASTCYAVGDAVVVCPVMDSAPPGSAPHTQHRLGADLFDLWTGVWDAPATAQGATLSSDAPLHWLAIADAGNAETSVARLPTAAFLAPAFLRAGRILATQNVLWMPEGGAEDAGDGGGDGTPRPYDAHTIYSTHMGANWTLTIALPPLPTQVTSQVLAEGSVFWDEGSHNSQQRPPVPQPGAPPLSAAFPAIPHHVQHCMLHLSCLYEAREKDAAPQLVVELRQSSQSCATALAQLQSHWQEEPEGFAERLTLAKERRDARAHVRDVEQNEKEDRGLRTRHTDGQRADSFVQDDLKGLRLPRWAEETARNDLWRSHLLQRLRFLFQREEEAARLADLHAAPLGSTVEVERRSVVGEAKAGTTTVAGRAPVRRCLSSSHEVLVDLSQVDNTTAPGGLAATPLFGITQSKDGGGNAVPQVPPTHTWRFIFTLRPH